MRGFANLERLEYPGRVIVVGRLPDGSGVVGYAVTGRSPSSRARKLVVGEDGHVYTTPTDEEALRKGNAALLVYPAVMLDRGGIAVSNGAQTRLVYEELSRGGCSPVAPAEVLARALGTPHLVDGIDVTRYEPDEPNFTPRISGCLTPDGAALSIARRDAGDGVERRIFDVSRLANGAGKAIATYSGPNQNPLPSFAGEPLDVAIAARSAAELAEELYAALGPELGRDDLRVAVVAVEHPVRGQSRIHIANRSER